MDLSDIPNGSYGDGQFLHMMWLKTVAGWIVNRLDYDLLYLDSDLIYRKDTAELFANQEVGACILLLFVCLSVCVCWLFSFFNGAQRGLTLSILLYTPLLPPPLSDIFMQDDGARSERFAPYFGNTGFFYVRANSKTKHLMQVRPSPTDRCGVSHGAGRVRAFSSPSRTPIPPSNSHTTQTTPKTHTHPPTPSQMMLYSYELVLAWRTHQAVFTYLMEDIYLRNLLNVKIIPLSVLPSGKIVSVRPPFAPWQPSDD